MTRPRLNLDRDQYLEFEKLAVGAFHPLTGFMTKDEFTSVEETMRLPSGDVFPLPVVLDIDSDQAAEIAGAEIVELHFQGIHVGNLIPSEVFTVDRPTAALAIYGTGDHRHPGVAHFQSLKSLFVGGTVTLLTRVRLDISDFELTPAESREVFAQRGWSTIAGFQTRNVPHRAHEYLQRIALETADGLFIQPLVGRKRPGDFTPQAILTGYQTLIGQFLPKHRVVLGVLSTVMRYAGPREAVFHAIVRRNYGCTHFIIGRDHAGVGDYYGLYDAHDLAHRLEPFLDINVLRLNGPFFCVACDAIATDKTCAHANTDQTLSISGTDMRAILKDGAKPDPRLMRPEVVAALVGTNLFIEAKECNEQGL